MKILQEHSNYNIKAVVFDFDGTISTLRRGWETVMAPMMAEYIGGGNPTEEIRALVRAYINESTGIQTILQMKWLAQTVKSYGLNPSAPTDPWEYKAEYNRRLMAYINTRKTEAANGKADDFIMDGAVVFFKWLKEQGYRLYAASGTDDADVKAESSSLGFYSYFDRIMGAMPGSEGCSKEATLHQLIDESGLVGREILVVGDGPVEIRLGRQIGALTLGIAGNEEARHGYDEAKITRLTNAGAHALADCFTELNEITEWIKK